MFNTEVAHDKVNNNTSVILHDSSNTGQHLSIARLRLSLGMRLVEIAVSERDSDPLKIP